MTIPPTPPDDDALWLTPGWCMEAFHRVNPGAAVHPWAVPSLYLLDFACEVLRESARRAARTEETAVAALSEAPDEPRVAGADEMMCMAQGDGVVCTRKLGHAGAHIAHVVDMGLTHEVRTWAARTEEERTSHE